MVAQNILNKIKEDPHQVGKNMDINKLVKLLKELSFEYFYRESLVEDRIYDILYDELERRDPKNSYLTQIGIHGESNMITLPYPMYGLKARKPITGKIDSWVKTYTGPYVLSDKLDGMSGMLVKNNNKIILYSRGTDTKGQNISLLLEYLFDKKILDNLPNDIAIRGEIIIKESNFKKYLSNYKKRNGNIEGAYKNARSAASAVVLSKKNLPMDILKITEFVAYAVVQPRMKQTDQLEKLKKWNLNVVKYFIFNNITDNDLIEHLKTRRKESEYFLDGIVVCDDSKIYNITNKIPTFMFKFKILSDDFAKTVVKNVEWNISLYGVLKPKIEIEPVILAGSTVKFATAHNARYIEKTELGPGAKITIIRSDEVIPYIQSVDVPAKNGAQMPGVPYVWDSTRTNISPIDLTTFWNEITIKRITRFFEYIESPHMGPGNVKKFIDNGYDSIFKILNAKTRMEELYKIKGMGEITINKIYKGIENALKNAPLYVIMAATVIFGQGLGRRKLKLIVDKYPDIMNYVDDKVKIKEMVINVPGFSDISTDKFVDGLEDFVKFYDELGTIYNLKENNEKISKSDKFNNMTFVFTGFRDKSMENYITENGGKVTSSVSKNTSLVVYVGTDSAKYVKAKNIDIETITKDEFIKKYMQNE